jgi:hypothetical protein
MTPHTTMNERNEAALLPRAPLQPRTRQRRDGRTKPARHATATRGQATGGTRIKVIAAHRIGGLFSGRGGAGAGASRC